MDQIEFWEDVLIGTGSRDQARMDLHSLSRLLDRMKISRSRPSALVRPSTCGHSLGSRGHHWGPRGPRSTASRGPRVPRCARIPGACDRVGVTTKGAQAA